MSTVSENKTAIRTRINNLYVTCGNISPLIYFIEGLTKEFNSILGNDFQFFESKLMAAESEIETYYNINGFRGSVDNSRMVYSVQIINESEGCYFYNMELANLFIKRQLKKVVDIKYRLSKIFRGYSVVVKSPIFFC